MDNKLKNLKKIPKIKSEKTRIFEFIFIFFLQTYGKQEKSEKYLIKKIKPNNNFG